jgi:lipoprotein-anchoring transpeptidase ErfK/SrfK
MFMRTLIVLLSTAALLAGGCARRETQPPPEPERRGYVRTGNEAEVPIERHRSAGVENDAERFDDTWRQLQSFHARLQRQGLIRDRGPLPPIQFASRETVNETLEGLDFARLDQLPVVVPVTGDVRGPTVLRTQVLLDRAGFSPGIIDGRWGKNSAIATYWFQESEGLEPTGDVDAETYGRLAALANAPALVGYSITEKDRSGKYVSIPRDVYEQEELDCLCYESMAEALAERFHTSVEFLRQMNPGVDLASAPAGTAIRVPNVADAPSGAGQIARIVVSARGWYLHGLDAGGNVVFHAPTTLGSQYDPSPDETLKITSVTFDPWFHYQPKLFYEVDDEEPEANLAPGPNSPVGVVWMALSKPHYGIHGTSSPETIGYATSHGCVRLTNWNARALGERVGKGTVVEFVDTRGEAENVPAR